MIGIAALSCLLTAGLLLHELRSGGGAPAGPRTAAIVDQLSLTQNNPDFVQTATDLLHRAGYAVDYYPGDKVTVDFYRRLPTLGYGLTLLRVHAGITRAVDVSTGQKTPTEYVSLFTGEPYSEMKYREEPIGRLGKAFYHEGAAPLFAITPEFIESSMQGRFNNTLIVMMGCDGLRSKRTAQAFLDRGASAFVSWSQPVSASHTDSATQELLQKLLIKRLSVEDAVTETAAELGPDPTYGGELRILP